MDRCLKKHRPERFQRVPKCRICRHFLASKYRTEENVSTNIKNWEWKLKKRSFKVPRRRCLLLLLLMDTCPLKKQRRRRSSKRVSKLVALYYPFLQREKGAVISPFPSTIATYLRSVFLIQNRNKPFLSPQKTPLIKPNSLFAFNLRFYLRKKTIPNQYRSKCLKVDYEKIRLEYNYYLQFHAKNPPNLTPPNTSVH